MKDRRRKGKEKNHKKLRPKKTSAETYAAECQVRTKRDRGQLIEELAQIKLKLQELYLNLQNLATEQLELVALLARIEGRSQDRKKMNRDLANILKIPEIERVGVYRGIIRIFTKDIIVTKPNTRDRYRLGKFRIEIFRLSHKRNLRNKAPIDLILCHNLTRQEPSMALRPNIPEPDAVNHWGGPYVPAPPTGFYQYNHPHVNQDGSCCFGNQATAIYTLIVEQEYAAMAGLLIGFLKTINEKSPYGGPAILERWLSEEYRVK